MRFLSTCGIVVCRVLKAVLALCQQVLISEMLNQSSDSSIRKSHTFSGRIITFSQITSSALRSEKISLDKKYMDVQTKDVKKINIIKLTYIYIYPNKIMQHYFYIFIYIYMFLYSWNLIIKFSFFSLFLTRHKLLMI